MELANDVIGDLFSVMQRGSLVRRTFGNIVKKERQKVLTCPEIK